MAYVTPNNDQKDAIKSEAEFRLQVKWSVLNIALYYKGLDGVNLPDAVASKKWATHRFYAAQLMDNPSQIESGLDQWVGQFSAYLNNFAVVDNSVQFNSAATVEYMKAQNLFEAIANLVFDAKCSTSNF